MSKILIIHKAMLALLYLHHYFRHNLGSSVSPGGLTALVLTLVLVMSVVGWVGYAYFQPHTWSGQLLIKVNSHTA